MKKTVYFIPGRGENLTDEIGQIIAGMGFSIQGREIISDFARLGFSGQLALIRVDLEPSFWHSEAVLIGCSFGAYLMLHALAEMKPFPGKMLLFSPVLGAGVSSDRLFGSIPPRSKKLLKLAQSREFPAPRCLEIHTGAEDNGCNPRLAERFTSLVGNTKLYLVSGAGHQLDQKYIRGVLEKFLIKKFPDPCEAGNF